MINGFHNRDLILNTLADGRPHFSREFVEKGLLEYRRRITELRRLGHNIISMRIEDPISHFKRPGYKLEFKTDLFVA